MTSSGFADYVASLRRIRATGGTGDHPSHEDLRQAAAAISELPSLTRATLAALAREHPEWVPALGLAAGLSQEQLRRALQQRLGSAGWVRLARDRADDLVAMLDEHFSLVERLNEQHHRTYSFGDILVARSGSRRTAGEAQAGGRGVEDAIEAIARELGVEVQLRTRFTGRAGRTAPADLAVPRGGEDAMIVCAAKGFDSTGSKLSDAVREIEEMAEVRLPRQYVFAVVDGIGWLGRRADLRRIYDLAAEHKIDGLYTLEMIEQFRDALADAARRLGLLA